MSPSLLSESGMNSPLNRYSSKRSLGYQDHKTILRIKDMLPERVLKYGTRPLKKKEHNAEDEAKYNDRVLK